MIIVTSFAPCREERQQYCLSTWRKYGLRVAAVQTAAELPAMKSQYADVQWSASTSDRPLITELANLAIKTDQPVLIVNSDIGIKNTPKDFCRDWLADQWSRPGTLRVGARWDRREDGRKSMQRYGIDAFLITPLMAESIPELGFQIGYPAWDYWIILHFHSLGYFVSMKKTLGLIHSIHARNWTDEQHDDRRQVITDRYGYTKKQATLTVQRLTGRTARPA